MNSEIPDGPDRSLIDAIQQFPLAKTYVHCGSDQNASPFDVYGVCNRCGARIKLRAMTAVTEIEDVFDAVFEWMMKPGAMVLVQRRQSEIASDP